MVDNAVMAQLWTKLRTAVHEFRVSRMQRKNVSGFRVTEQQRRRTFHTRRASRRGPYSSGGRFLFTRYNELKRVLHRKTSLLAAAAVNFKGSANSSKPGWRFTSVDESEGSDEGLSDGVLLAGEEESIALVLTRWKEMGIENITPERSFSAISPPSSSHRWEDLDINSPGDILLASSMSVKSPAFQSGESSSSNDDNYRRLDNLDWRLSYRSAQLLQPIRGKLTTLSSLMMTTSDRYARRTGKLTPLHERTSKQRLVTQSLSASPWTQQQHKFSTSKPTSCTASSIALSVKRYDNPFQDFLRRSYLEKHSKFAQQYMLQNGLRNEGSRWSIG